MVLSRQLGGRQTCLLGFTEKDSRQGKKLLWKDIGCRCLYNFGKGVIKDGDMIYEKLYDLGMSEAFAGQFLWSIIR